MDSSVMDRDTPAAVPVKKIVVVVEDLFFLAKIRETARLLGVALDCVRTPAEVEQKLAETPPPNLVIVDLNGRQSQPIDLIAGIRRQPAYKRTTLVGFLSHLQAELKQQAQAAGCDLVMPRSAFSQNLPALLRRHGLPDPA